MSHQEKIKVLSSSISHMPLHSVFRDSGVAEKHGFELEVDVAKVPQRGKPTRTIGERAALAVRAGVEAEVNEQDGWITVGVDRITDHEVVVLS